MKVELLENILFNTMSTIDQPNPSHSRPCGRYQYKAPSPSSFDDVGVEPTHRESIHPIPRISSCVSDKTAASGAYVKMIATAQFATANGELVMGFTRYTPRNFKNIQDYRLPSTCRNS